MKTIADIDQHKLGIREDTDVATSFLRVAARAVLTNDQGQIAVMHFTGIGSYKLPGGGVDAGEDVVDGLRREILEETGYGIADIQELGIVEEDRYYRGMHQTSYCFKARTVEFIGTNYTEKESRQGMNLRWADNIEQAIEWIESSHSTDEDGSETGLTMMKLRDKAILEAAIQL